MAIKYSSIGGGSGTGFNVQIGSKYSYATFTQALPAGAYTIKSSNNYTNWDVYLLGADSSLIAYTGSASISPTAAFSAIVVVNGTVNDILQFSYQTTVFSTAETTQTTAGPFITNATPTSLPNANNTITVTGGNFASGITATFTGTDLTPRTAKGIVRNSATSIVVTRPDNMPQQYAPYTLTLGNPGIYNPTTSNSHIQTGISVGGAPAWTTSANLPSALLNVPYSVTLVATDPDAGGSISYSYVSGTLPSGVSFNASTGVISGTPTNASGTSFTYTVRATDSGANTTDRTFTIPYAQNSGGTITTDGTYWYHNFLGNGNLVLSQTQVADILIVGGGAGGSARHAGGSGAGSMLTSTGYSLSANTYPITIGAGSTGVEGNGVVAANGAATTAFGATLNGGGYGGVYGDSGQTSKNANSGGSGGGGGYQTSAGGANQTAQSFGTVYANAGSTSPGGVVGGGGGGAGAAGSGSKGGDGRLWLDGYYYAGGGGGSGWQAAAGAGGLGGAGGGNTSDYIGNAVIPGGLPGSGGRNNGTQGQFTNESSGLVRGGDAGANTGSGGGGGCQSGYTTFRSQGGNGGSGIVVVRYAR